MVYIIKATGELPLPSSLTARPSENIVTVPNNSGRKSQKNIYAIQTQKQIVSEGSFNTSNSMS